MTPFDYIKAINKGEDLEVDSDYSQYLVNVFFSLFPDTVLFANEMNCVMVTDQQHFDYLRANIRPRARYKKWPKKQKESDENLALVMYYYKYSSQKAKEALAILNEGQIASIRKITDGE